MHQYLDQDGSGTHPECVSATIGVERIKDATAWLKSNKKKGILGEFAGGPSDVCKQAVQGMLDSLVTNNDVWMGAMAWAAGESFCSRILSLVLRRQWRETLIS